MKVIVKKLQGGECSLEVSITYGIEIEQIVRENMYV